MLGTSLRSAALTQTLTSKHMHPWHAVQQAGHMFLVADVGTYDVSRQSRRLAVDMYMGRVCVRQRQTDREC